MDRNEKKELKIDLLAQFLNNDFKNPGPSTIYSDYQDEASTVIYFGGAGIVTHIGEDISDVFIGQRVAVCGFMKGKPSSSIITSRNNIVELPKSMGYSDGAFCGFLLPLINAIHKAALAIGENVLIVGEGKSLNLMKQLVMNIGCNVVCWIPGKIGEKVKLSEDIMKTTDNHGVDAVFVFSGCEYEEIMSEIGNACRYEGRIIYIDAIKHDSAFYGSVREIIYSSDLGKGYFDEAYMNSDKDYPYPYVYDTVNMNMRQAIKLIADKKFKPEDYFELKYINDRQFSSLENDVDKATIFVKKSDRNESAQESLKEIGNIISILPEYTKVLTSLYFEHYNPCILQITYQCKEINEQIIKRILVTTGNIIQSEAAHCVKSGNAENILSITVTCADGAVAVMNLMAGFDSSNERYEMHWDGQTAIYLPGQEVEVFSNNETRKINFTVDFTDEMAKSIDNISRLGTWMKIISHIKN